MLDRFPQSDTAAAATVGGGASGNDEQTRGALLSVRHANKRERWAIFRQVLEMAVYMRDEVRPVIAGGQFPHGAMLRALSLSHRTLLLDATNLNSPIAVRLYAEATRTNASDITTAAVVAGRRTLAYGQLPVGVASRTNFDSYIGIRQPWLPPDTPWTLVVEKTAGMYHLHDGFLTIHWAIRHF